MGISARDWRRTSSLAPSNVHALPGGRIPVLDGLRGIAVLLVMVFHFWLFGTATGTMLWERTYASVAGMGWVGVDLFFVLSGFLITGILYDSRGNQHYYRVFYARRTVRIFPLYYASLAIFFWIIPFLLMRLHHREVFDTHNSALAKVFVWTYFINWYTGLKGFSVVSLPLQHFWSLAVEEQFYLVWPFLVLTLPRRRLLAVCCGLMACGFVIRAVLYWVHLPYAAYTWSFCRADALAIGAMVALAQRNPHDWKTLVKWAPFVAFPAICALAVLRVLNPQSSGGPGHSPNFLMGTFGVSLVGIFFGGCLAMTICLRPDSLMHGFLGSSFLRFFGKYSYCLYICHVPLIAVLARIGLRSDNLAIGLHNKLLAVILVNGIAFAAAILIALASWHLFEKHWLKLKDLPFLHRENRFSGAVTNRSGSIGFVTE